MTFYILSFSSLLLTTIYLYFNKIVARKYNNDYSFQIGFYSFIAAIILTIFEFTNKEFFFDLKLAWIFIIIIGLKFALRTILTEKVLKKVDAGYFEIFTKFNLIFLIIFEYLFLKYQIPIGIYFSFVIFFIGLIITLKFKSEKGLNKENIGMLLIIALLFSVDPFLTRFVVENGYLSLSLSYFFELLIGTIFIGILRPKTVKFNISYLKDFLPLALVRMVAAYLAGKAILIGSPTIVELIKGCSLLLLFIVPIFIEKKILPLKTWIGIIITFIGVSLIIFFK